MKINMRHLAIVLTQISRLIEESCESKFLEDLRQKLLPLIEEYSWKAPEDCGSGWFKADRILNDQCNRPFTKLTYTEKQIVNIWEDKPRRCLFCGESDVEKVEGIEPWSGDHWGCPKCDSTYYIIEYE